MVKIIARGLFLLLIYLPKILPYTLMKGIIALFSFIASQLLSRYIEIAKINFHLIFKKSVHKKEIKKHIQQIYKFFGNQAIELLYYMYNKYPYGKLVESIEGLNHLQEAHKQNKGIILISAHIGNFTHISLILNELGFPDNSMIMRATKDKFIENRLSIMRRNMGIAWFNESYSKKNTLMLARFVKNEKGILILLTDQRHQKGTPLEFFSNLKKTPLGAASLSMLTKAPILPFFAIRTPSGRSHCVIKDPIYLDTSLAYDESVVSISNKINKILETQILQHFDQWLCLNRWWR